ncbi:MAG: hypothetical protein WCT85_03525 [Parachlamydiales bacterium]|jgi:DNA modification methylase
MSGRTEINIEFLKNNSMSINEKIEAEALELINEKDLIFTKPILIEGKAYLTEDTLIINLDIKFYVSLPCSFCNELFEKEIIIKNFYITEKLSNIDNSYDFKQEVRNACFLEIPSYVECKDKCSKRQSLNNFLNQKNQNFPFANLKEK